MLGGNLHNNVVVATTLYFQRLKITTCRFDFCGSQLGQGHAQVVQCREITDKLLKGDFCVTPNSTPPKAIIFVGYSYGSLITNSVSAEIPECIASIGISPPFGVQMWLLMFASQSHLQKAASRPNLPRLFVMGDDDNFTTESRLRTTLDHYFPNATAAIIQDADHFWVRRESDVLGVVGQWLNSTLGKGTGATAAQQQDESGSGITTSLGYVLTKWQGNNGSEGG
jgi:alpha/beta superfamily hydrolase